MHGCVGLPGPVCPCFGAVGLLIRCIGVTGERETSGEVSLVSALLECGIYSRLLLLELCSSFKQSLAVSLG